MENLIKRKKYNAGKRPSEHGISPTAFFRDNGGSIPHNLFELDAIDASRDVRLPHNILSYSNTTSNDYYFKRCREKNISPHPARMHGGLINFFIDFLTDEGDLVLDPFAGSNTTGYCAEKLNRRWISIEANKSYALDSMIRFEDPELNTKIKLFEI